jgi:sugar/nucleoside kinase (ribokinase family)
VVVIGGANVDIKAACSRAPVPATSNPGTTVIAPGGVGRNIAENLARLGSPVHLVAAVGADALGDQILAATALAGVGVDRVRRDAPSTGTYVAVLDAGGALVVAVAAMAATDALSPEDVDDARGLISGAALLVLDGNLASETVGAALDLAAAAGVPVVLDPVSVPKAGRLADRLRPGRPVHLVTPNEGELAALTGRPVETPDQLLAAARILHDSGVEQVWVRLGDRGSVLSGPDGIQTFPATATEVVDVTGAGDAMLAAFCHAVLGGAAPAEAAAYGHAAAALTVASPHTVRPDLTDRLVEALLV